MTDDQDHFEAFYADKLWNLLPAVYRALDTDQFNANGPLRELVNRIGAQAAVVRRNTDRMWEDQSIETCDDWVISYLGDLVATNLVVNLDTRGQRLDVAKTIYYRRRKGTIAILEEIASDITGWNAKAVEFFRRLGRTRHGLDPALGLSGGADDPGDALQVAQGLIGPFTRTGIGGLADLRNVYGSSKADSAFDEFFHTADFRLGQGRVGWYDLPRLGIFLWRLQSFGVDQTTPVQSLRCPNQFTFDPTGRDIPLFGVALRNYGNDWTSPAEWQLPTPISRALLGLALADPDDYPLYATSASDLKALGVFQNGTLAPTAALTADPTAPNSASSAGFFIDPARGRLYARHSVPVGNLSVTYHYGFPSTIGAGPYDRRVQGSTPATTPTPVSGGGNHLASSLATLQPAATLTIGDFLTYTSTRDVGSAATPITAVTIGAENTKRPLVRLPPATAAGVSQWVFTAGNATNPGQLVLDGLFISGGDVVLRGAFSAVTLRCCTLDPGSLAPLAVGPGAAPFALAADNRPLIPCRLWIEGTVTALTVDRSILGPIRTRSGGQVETLTVSNSIVQAIPTIGAGAYSAPIGTADVADAAIALDDGVVILSRCTVLGPTVVHRLQASECILQGLAQVDDTQNGCVRFSAWVQGSSLPRQYESVSIAPGTDLFTATDFGQPGFCQLLESVDAAIAAGGENETEMGAYARDLNPVRAAGLLVKFQEYMPAGLVPVLVNVT